MSRISPDTFRIYAQLPVPPVFDSYSPDPLIPYVFLLQLALLYYVTVQGLAGLEKTDGVD